MPTVYRVHLYEEQEGSQGFVWAGSHRAAQRISAAFKKATPKRNWPQPEVQKLFIPTHKAGLLEFLNRFAKHPDNG